MSSRGARIAVPLVVLGLATLAALAATVELTVRERDGAPIPNQPVELHHTAAAGEIRWSTFNFWRSGKTGAGGKVTFSDVPVGSYTFELDGVVDSALVNPEENPYAPAPEFTVAKDGDKLALTLELWRGVPLTAQVILDRGDMPKSKLVLRSLDGLHTRELPLDERRRWQGTIVAGRWDAVFEFPAGYLLVDLVANGEALPGFTARLDLAADNRSSIVTAFLSAQSLIAGRLSDPGQICPVTVWATLVEPGGWIAAATARGGSQFRDVAMQFTDMSCNYQLWLPAGSWLVRPHGLADVEAEPAETAVSIAEGETRKLDFTLRIPEGDGRQSLHVSVRAPDDRPLTGATVEVYRRTAEENEGEPLATGKTTWRPAEFRLQDGAYGVVAGHPRYLEAETIVPDFKGGAKEPTTVSITLREGAKIRAHATDENGKAVREVELAIERQGEPPKMKLHAEEIRAAKLARQVVVDDTGYADVPGLYSGNYRMTARMTGEAAGTKFVQVRKPSSTAADILETSLADGEVLDIDLVVLPAASIAGTLACSDRGTMPPKASFRLFDATTTLAPWSDVDLRAGGVLAADGVVLTGKELDHFRVGPLERGTLRLAARPAGHEYWSWPAGLLLPERSATFELGEKAPFDAGLVELECGPVVMLVPRIASLEPVPDLKAGTLELPPKVLGRVEIEEDRVFVLALPEGKARFAATFRHPYLIPPEIRIPEREVELLRGKLVEIELPAERVGGLLEVHGDLAAARITAADGRTSTRIAVDHTAAFPGTLPETYRVDSCADAECARVLKTWPGVTVTAGQATTLR